MSLSRWFLATLMLLTACGQAVPPPTFTPAPTLTPTPPPTATPTRTPTPPPLARLEQADAAQFMGDWETALTLYQALATTAASASAQATAQFRLGQTYWLAGQPVAAQQALNALMQGWPASPLAADARFLLAEIAFAAQDWATATAHYRHYQAARPTTLDFYVEARLAAAAAALGDTPAALRAYRAAMAAPRTSPDFSLHLALADLLTRTGQTEEALGVYTQVAQTAPEGWRVAQALVLAGNLLETTGNTAAAYANYQQAVADHPQTASAFQALVRLVNVGEPVDDFQRGLTNFHAQNYGPALAAFARLIEADDRAPAAWFYTGRIHAAQGQTTAALAAFAQTIQQGEASQPEWAEAHFQTAFLQDYPADAETFLAFVAAAPAHPRAPDALFRAARLHERHTNLTAAAELWWRLAQDYPTDPLAADAANQAGVALFRTGQVGPARQRFEAATTLGTNPVEHARAWLWVGKCRQTQGRLAEARAAWQTATTLAPTDYYGLRAARIATEARLFTSSTQFNPQAGSSQERAEAEAWLRATFSSAAASADLFTLGSALQADPRLLRGQELWRLGLWQAAHSEFNAVRLAWLTDPLVQWQLAVYFNQIQDYDQSIRAARQVADLAGLSDPNTAPTYLQRLRFPAPFGEAVLSAGARYTIPPAVMYAKMRIESFFWKFAFSSAQARGLNQIIPSTANDIARRLSLTDFVQEDLFRPVMSIPMGAYYLRFVASTTTDTAEAMLSGYYAGPGNTNAWLRLSGDDPDLFVEVIRLPDAKGYVQTTYEFFEMYTRLYGN